MNKNIEAQWEDIDGYIITNAINKVLHIDENDNEFNNDRNWLEESAYDCLKGIDNLQDSNVLRQVVKEILGCFGHQDSNELDAVIYAIENDENMWVYK